MQYKKLCSALLLACAATSYLGAFAGEDREDIEMDEQLREQRRQDQVRDDRILEDERWDERRDEVRRQDRRLDRARTNQVDAST